MSFFSQTFVFCMNALPVLRRGWRSFIVLFGLAPQLSSSAWNLYLDMLIFDLTATVIYKDLGWKSIFQTLLQSGHLNNTSGVSPLDYLPRTVSLEKGDQVNEDTEITWDYMYTSFVCYNMNIYTACFLTLLFAVVQLCPYFMLVYHYCLSS